MGEAGAGLAVVVVEVYGGGADVADRPRAAPTATLAAGATCPRQPS